MKTKAIRINGVNDLRLDEFELPEIRDDEILAKVVSDSICMSAINWPCRGPLTSGSAMILPKIPSSSAMNSAASLKR